MNIDNLKAELAPWIRVGTWHTAHPLDEQRFHRALKSAFDSFGTSIACADFREAITQLANELHSEMLASYREEVIDKFAQTAENIGSYLHDNSI